MIGTDTQDNRILSFLRKQPIHVSEMSRHLGIKRTSVTYRLQRLERLGLIKGSLLGNKRTYSLKFKKVGLKDYIQNYSGDAMADAYKNLLHLPKETIIFAIQGNHAAKWHLKHLPESLISEIHRVFKKKKIILRGISNTEVVNIFKKMSTSMIRSHKGRTLGIKLLENKFAGDGEMMVTKNFILLSNPRAKRVILIKDPAITEMVYEVLALLLESLGSIRIIDINAYLGRLKHTEEY